MHLSVALSLLLNADQATSTDVAVISRTLCCGGVVLDLDHRRGFAGEVDLGFSAAEFAMVHLLFSRRGVPMSKEAISAGLPVRVDPRMVDVYVSRARAKLSSAGLDGAIETVWGRGYMARLADDGLSTEPPTSQDLDAALVPA